MWVLCAHLIDSSSHTFDIPHIFQKIKNLINEKQHWRTTRRSKRIIEKQGIKQKVFNSLQ